MSVSTLCSILWWWLLTSTILQVHELEKRCGLLPRHGRPHPADVGSMRCTLVPLTSVPIPFSLPRWQEEEVSLGNIDCTPPVKYKKYSDHENLPHWLCLLYSHPTFALPIVRSSHIGSNENEGLTWPQLRQWCLLFFQEKVSLQAAQLRHSLSGTQF